MHGEVVRIFAEGADQHLKHQEQSKHDKALAAKTGTSYLPKPDPFPVPVLVDYLQKCLAATKHSRRYCSHVHHGVWYIVCACCIVESVITVTLHLLQIGAAKAEQRLGLDYV